MLWFREAVAGSHPGWDMWRPVCDPQDSCHPMEEMILGKLGAVGPHVERDGRTGGEREIKMFLIGVNYES